MTRRRRRRDDKDDKARIYLNVDSQGRPGVSLYDRDSKRRLLLAVDSAPYINLLDTSDKAFWRAP